MLLDTFGAKLTSTSAIRAGEDTVRSWQGFSMLSHPLTNFKIQKYYQNKPKINGVYSRNLRYNLPKMKDRINVINLDEFKSIGTYWIALYVNSNNIIYLAALELNIFQKKLKNS